MLTLTASIIAFLGGLLVSYVNNRVQKDRDEAKLIREKGELIVSKLVSLSEVYLHKYNVAQICMKNESDILMEEKFGLGSQMYVYVDNLESQIFSLTRIYFPDCKFKLDNLREKHGAADAYLRIKAANRYVGGELGELDRVSEFQAACFELTDNIVNQVEVIVSRSLYKEVGFAMVWPLVRRSLPRILIR